MARGERERERESMRGEETDGLIETETERETSEESRTTAKTAESLALTPACSAALHCLSF